MTLGITHHGIMIRGTTARGTTIHGIIPDRTGTITTVHTGTAAIITATMADTMVTTDTADTIGITGT